MYTIYIFDRIGYVGYIFIIREDVFIKCVMQKMYL